MSRSPFRSSARVKANQKNLKFPRLFPSPSRWVRVGVDKKYLVRIGPPLPFTLLDKFFNSPAVHQMFYLTG